MPGGVGPPGVGGRGAIASRQPPSWSPEREPMYTFRQWAQDLIAWSAKGPPTWTALNNAPPLSSTSAGPLASSRAP
eukprot:8068534-Pyramimonas_sp.AAC.1